MQNQIRINVERWGDVKSMPKSRNRHTSWLVSHREGHLEREAGEVVGCVLSEPRKREGSGRYYETLREMSFETPLACAVIY